MIRQFKGPFEKANQQGYSDYIFSYLNCCSQENGQV